MVQKSAAIKFQILDWARVSVFANFVIFSFFGKKF
jgi:hypothetical protein